MQSPKYVMPHELDDVDIGIVNLMMDLTHKLH